MWKFQGSIKKENKFLGGYFPWLWALVFDLGISNSFFRISRGKVTNLKIPGFLFFQKNISSTSCLDFSLITPATHLNYKILVSIKHRRVSDKDYAGNKILFSYDGSSFTNEQKLLALPNKLATTSFIKFLFLFYCFTSQIRWVFPLESMLYDQLQVIKIKWPSDCQVIQLTGTSSRNKEKRQLASYLKIAWEQTQKITR